MPFIRTDVHPESNEIRTCSKYYCLKSMRKFADICHFFTIKNYINVRIEKKHTLFCCFFLLVCRKKKCKELQNNVDFAPHSIAHSHMMMIRFQYIGICCHLRRYYYYLPLCHVQFSSIHIKMSTVQ